MATPTTPDSDSGRITAERDFALLCREEGQRHMSRGQLAKALKLALLCGSHTERAIVAFALWHQLPFDQVAQRVHLTLRRTQELYNSLLRRSQAAEDRRRRVVRPAPKGAGRPSHVRDAPAGSERTSPAGGPAS